MTTVEAHTDLTREYEAILHSLGGGTFRLIPQQALSRETYLSTGYGQTKHRVITEKSVAVYDSLPYAQTSELASGIRYILCENPCAQGGLGVIHKAYDLRLHKFVAFKFISPENLHVNPQERVTRLLREVDAMVAHEHPGILTVYDLIELDHRLAFIMDWRDPTEMPTLQSAVGTDGHPLTFNNLRGISTSLAQVLDYCAKHGILHRDLKPSNAFFLRQENRAQLADFGLARILTQDDPLLQDRIGTARYMSPERLKGETEKFSSEIYSFALIIYYLLTGEEFFNFNNLGKQVFTQTLYKCMCDPQFIVERLEQGWHKIEARYGHLGESKKRVFMTTMARSLARRPLNRQRSATELVTQLMPLFEELDLPGIESQRQ